MNTPYRCLRLLSIDHLIDALRVAMIALPLFATLPVKASAEELAYTISVWDEEEWDEAPAAPLRLAEPSATRTAPYGPFRVRGEVAELVGAIDADTPQRFKAMMAAHPGIRRIEMIECPGSEDDDANLALARLVHKAGLETHVPSNGSIRSGGVELFLAGVKRSIDPGAQVGVHAWEDSDGLQATDFTPDDPVHQPYLRFYIDVGMSNAAARAFYDFTNHAAPFDGLHVMTGSEIQRFGLVRGSASLD